MDDKNEKKKIIIYDCTLREGAQWPGASFTLEDKLRMISVMENFGADYIEAGNPFSNPKDAALFERLRTRPEGKAKIVAFGSTARPGTSPESDAGLAALIASGAKAVCIYGKAWDLHVQDVLKTNLSSNIADITASVEFLKDHGLEVIFDAEHFFDGFKANRSYAMDALYAASAADYICLCDTNGGTMPDEMRDITEYVKQYIHTPLGIHCHNDAGMAQANSVIAVLAGADMVQATANGWGERCGNADIFALTANLQLKKGFACVPESSMHGLVSFSRSMWDIANVSEEKSAPYVGQNAFSHKAGAHIDAIYKNHASFEHIDPALIGAQRHFLLSEVAGRAALLQRARRIDPDMEKDSPSLMRIITHMKELEYQGYQFESALASLDLIIMRELRPYESPFSLIGFKIFEDNPPSLHGETASAMIRIEVQGKEGIGAAIGNGPVNALDGAARQALLGFYPEIAEMHLTDFRVRVLDSRKATASAVRVLIETSDSSSTWTTIGVSEDIINASWIALRDSIEYKLIMGKNR